MSSYIDDQIRKICRRVDQWKEDEMIAQRAAIVTELLSLWEEGAAVMRKAGELGAAAEIQTAINVLKKTYSAAELGTDKHQEN